MNMSFKEAARALGLDAAWEGSFSGICIDSRKVEKGCLFAAIRGEHFDGNDFVQSAIADGAAGVLVSRDVGEASVPVLRVEDTVQGLMALAGAYRRRFDIPVAGVTGSVGKTTTKEMIACVLSERYRTLKTEGNFNNEIGLPLTLLRMDESTQAAVIEMGMSNFGEISRLSRCTRPTLAGITKIGVSHMETLGSQEGILKAKMEIIEGLEPGAPLLVNGDDPFLRDVSAQGHPVYSFGMENPDCDFLAEDVRSETFCTRFTLRQKGGEALSVVLPAVGLHNVLNAAAAFGAGVLLGVEPEKAVRGLSGYVPSGMRQRVVICDGITVIEDCYNASPDSMRASLAVLERFPHTGKRVAVLGDMLELGSISEQAHREIGALASQKADILFACGPLARYYMEGAKEAGMQTCLHFDSNEALSEALLMMVGQGDVLLFKASRGMSLETAIKPLYERWKR